jgi:hypothetical protein
MSRGVLVLENKGMWAIIMVVLLLVVGSASFWLGMKYQQQRFINQVRQRFGSALPGQGIFGQGAQNAQGVPQGGGRGSPILTAKVDKVNEDVITITTRFGSQKISLSSEVEVQKPASATFSDLKVGSQVIVVGERDDKGNFKASKIIVTSSPKR